MTAGYATTGACAPVPGGTTDSRSDSGTASGVTRRMFDGAGEPTGMVEAVAVVPEAAPSLTMVPNRNASTSSTQPQAAQAATTPAPIDWDPACEPAWSRE